MDDCYYVADQNTELTQDWLSIEGASPANVRISRGVLDPSLIGDLSLVGYVRDVFHVVFLILRSLEICL